MLHKTSTLRLCEGSNVPIDFVTTHHYPTDALGHEDDDTEWNSSSNPRDPRHDEPFAHAPEPSGVWLERIDEHHANGKRRWQALGAPEYLDSPAVEQLHEASGMVREACPWTWRDGWLALEIEPPPHAVAALTTEFAPS